MKEMTWRGSDLSITLRTEPSQQNFQRVTFAVTYRAFSAERESLLDAGDIQRFAGEVDRMWSRLAGDAELYGEHGLEFTFRLTTRPGGHVGVYIQVIEHTARMDIARMDIEAETDQTFLPSLRDGLLSIV